MKNHLYIRRENVLSVSFAVICLATAEGNIFVMTMAGCSNIFTKLGEKAKSCSGDVENAFGFNHAFVYFLFFEGIHFSWSVIIWSRIMTFYVSNKKNNPVG